MSGKESNLDCSPNNRWSRPTLICVSLFIVADCFTDFKGELHAAGEEVCSLSATRGQHDQRAKRNLRQHEAGRDCVGKGEENLAHLRSPAEMRSIHSQSLTSG